MALATLGFCSCYFTVQNVEKKRRFSRRTAANRSSAPGVSNVGGFEAPETFLDVKFVARFRLTCKKYLGANQNGGNRVLVLLPLFFSRIKANRLAIITSNRR
jgi:hypothetical protein